jgi:hypothetical protein
MQLTSILNLHKKSIPRHGMNGKKYRRIVNPNILFILMFLMTILMEVKLVGQEKLNSLVDSNFQIKNSNKNTKKWVLGTVQATLWGGSFYSLNKAWYANYPRKKFHFYNDWKEWQQMDKVGHLWSTYQISEQTSKLWQWTGTEKKKAIWLGSISGLAYLSIIEILDGYSDKWGFSIPDVMANSAGAGLYLGQALLWDDQRIRIKLSYQPYPYGSLKGRADQLFGAGNVEKLLKDYNGQTYWASINIRSFFPDSKFPPWLNIALGYGAETMLGGYQNTWKDPTGAVITRFDLPRYKKFLISADIDLTKIPVKNKVLKTTFSIFNVLKIPAPTIQFSTNGKPVYYGIYY